MRVLVLSSTLSVAFYNYLSKFRVFQKIYKKLSWLDQSLIIIGYPLPYYYYVSYAIALTLIAFVALFPIFTFVHLFLLKYTLPFAIVLGFLLSFIASNVVFAVLLLFPSVKLSSIKVKMESYAPYAVMILASLAASGQGVQRMLESSINIITEKNTKNSIKRIVASISAGKDVADALYEESRRIPSLTFSILYEGLAGISHTGVGTTQYLSRFLADNISALESKTRTIIDKLSILVETYVIAAIVFPLLIIISIVFLGSFGGFKIPPEQLMLIVSTIVIPFIFSLLLLTADSTLSEVSVE